MIISQKHGLAFIHVPKNGGLGVRRQLAQLHDHDETFHRVIRTPAYGSVDLTHMRGEVLADLYPEVLAFLRSARVFALYREPHGRFRSAASQTLKSRGAKPLLEMTADELRPVIDGLIGEVEARRYREDPSLVYFTPQAEFLYVDEDFLPTDLYPIERLDEMVADIASLSGETVESPGAANQTVALRAPWLRGPLHKMNDAVRRALPTGLYRSLRAAATPLVVRSGRTPADDVFAEPRVRNFVEAFYASDFALRERCVEPETS
jgi:hypothetical protein